MAADQLLVPDSYIEHVILGGLLFVFAITTVIWLIVRARRSNQHDRR